MCGCMWMLPVCARVAVHVNRQTCVVVHVSGCGCGFNLDRQDCRLCAWAAAFKSFYISNVGSLV